MLTEKADSVIANRYRETNVSPVVNCPTQIEERDTPRCPNCGSDFVMPTLLAIGEWECWEPSCYAVWTVEP